MSGSDSALIIYALGQFITAGVAAYSAYLSHENGRKIEEVHKATNSMKDELVQATATASFAEGAKSETDKRP